MQDFDLINGRHYQFDLPSPSAPPLSDIDSEALSQFQRLNKIVEPLFVAVIASLYDLSDASTLSSLKNLFASLSKQVDFVDDEDEAGGRKKKAVKAYISGQYSLVLYWLDQGCHVQALGLIKERMEEAAEENPETGFKEMEMNMRK